MRQLTPTIMNRFRAEAHQPKPRTVIISITNPGSGDAILADGYAAVHRAKFWDITAPVVEDDEEYLPMTPAQAAAMMAFARTALPRADHLVVHCEAGISRSAGSAVALAEIFGLGDADDLARRYPNFNRHVRRALWRAAADLKEEGAA